MEYISSFFANVFCTAFGALIMYLIRLVHRGTNKHIYKNKLLINKNQINDDFSNIICYTANPDVFDEQEHTNLGYPFEHMALGEINSMFRYVYKIDKSIPCKMSKPNFEDYNHEFQNHLILIGGPNHNSITKNLIFSNSKIPFSYNQNNTLVYFQKNGSSEITKTYSPQMADGDNNFFKKDYALILNIKNPHDYQKRIILICGCRSIGCYGGAVFLSNYLKKIKKIVNDPEYALVVECKGNDDGLISEPKFVDYYSLNTE